MRENEMENVSFATYVNKIKSNGFGEPKWICFLLLSYMVSESGPYIGIPTSIHYMSFIHGSSCKMNQNSVFLLPRTLQLFGHTYMGIQNLHILKLSIIITTHWCHVWKKALWLRFLFAPMRKNATLSVPLD